MRHNMNDLLARSLDVDVAETELIRAMARLPMMMPGGPWLAGGALRRSLAHQPLESDFDVFFASAEQLDKFVEHMKERGAWIVSSTDHNITMRLPAKKPEPIEDDRFSRYEPELTVQAIRIAYYDSAEAVIDSFDFTICQFATDGVDLISGPYALWDLARRRLALHKLTYGASTMRRLLKYTRQGFTACGGVLADILERAATDPSVIQRETLYID